MKERLISELTQICLTFRGIAIFQHFVFFIAVGLVLFSGRHMRTLLALWMTLTAILIGNLSVIYSKNYFNGIMFWLIGVMFFFDTGIIKQFEAKLLSDEREINPIQKSLGIAGIILGIIYPHFVKNGFPLTIFTSSFGIIPVPTLMIFLSIQIIAFPGVRLITFGITAFISVLYSLLGFFGAGLKYDLFLFILSVFAFYQIISNIKNLTSIDNQQNPDEKTKIRKEKKNDFSDIQI